MLEESGTLVSCSEDKKLIFWDYREKKILKSMQKGEYFKTIDYIYSLNLLIGGNMDKRIYTIEISDFLDKKKMGLEGPAEEIKEVKQVDEKKEEEEDEEEKTFMLEEKERKIEEETTALVKDYQALFPTK